jgi:hypothetical protein
MEVTAAAWPDHMAMGMEGMRPSHLRTCNRSLIECVTRRTLNADTDTHNAVLVSRQQIMVAEWRWR